MVIITGQVPTPLIGNDAFQEADIIGITRPCTKHNFLVRDVKDLATDHQEGLLHRPHRPPRPGPGRPAQGCADCPDRVRLPGDRRAARLQAHLQRQPAPGRKGRGHDPGGDAAGRSTSAAGPSWPMPQTSSTSWPQTDPGSGHHDPDGAGLLSRERHPLSLGMLGMHGTYYANMAMTNSDLMIAIGARFDDRVTGKIATFAPHAKIIHVDVDPTSIKKNVRVDLPIVGDCKDVLSKMLKELGGQARGQGGRVQRNGLAPWHDEIAGWKEKHPMSYNTVDHGHQAAVRHPEAARAVRRRCHHLHRCRPAPDVDGPVLPVQPAAHLALLRRTRHDGLRPAGGHGRPGGLPRASGHRLSAATAASR